GSPAVGTMIHVIGPSTVGAGENFPIDVPQNVMIMGVGSGAVTVQVSSGANGFRLRHTSSGLSTLIVDGQSAAEIGLVADGSSNLTTTVTAVEVRNSTKEGILIKDSILTIKAGTNVHGNGKPGTASGLHVTGSGYAEVTTSSDPIAFNSNTQCGIWVDGLAKVHIVGVAGAPNVTANNNAHCALAVAHPR